MECEIKVPPRIRVVTTHALINTCTCVVCNIFLFQAAGVSAVQSLCSPFPLIALQSCSCERPRWREMGFCRFLLLCAFTSCMLSGVVTGQAVEGQRMRNATAALSKHFQKLRQYELGVDELQVRRRR